MAIAVPSHATSGSTNRSTPSGLITFLFSDIEGSAHRWEACGEAMRLALRRHDRLMRAAIERSGGRVFKTMGDQFCAAFPRAHEAVAAAASAQRSLAAEDWSAIDGLRVRMAIHTGTTDEREGDYYGPAVNRVARLLALGHGGQVLLSGFSAETSRAHLPPGCALYDLGAHKLKDLEHCEHVFGLVIPEAARTFGTLRSLGTPNNLPAALTAFVGRETEVAEVRERLESSRLVTLTGSGGVGKTRTALQVGTVALDRFRDGVWLVELAPVADPKLVASAIAEVFRVDDAGGSRLLVESVAMALRGRQLLLVLDNCEHVISAAAEAAERILQSAPGVRVIATSREPLRVSGECVYRIPSLAVPPREQFAGAHKAAAYAAVALFVDRARAADGEFTLTDANAPVVADVVRRLDGIALAIELAAPLVKVLPLDELDRRLDERFKLLTAGSRTALPRQQTLRALIDWSYDLLGDSEASLLRQLAIFRDGWTTEAAAAVCTDDDPGEWDVLALLSRLVDKSLVVTERGAEGPRYRLLESTRQYALERLDESGSLERVSARHCRYHTRLSCRLSESSWLINRDLWLSQARAELENYRAAVAWGLERGNDVLSGAQIVANLGETWRESLAREGSALVEKALHAVGRLDAQVRARLLTVQAQLAFDGGLGLEAATEAVELFETGDDRRRQSEALRELGNSLGRVDRPYDAIERFGWALALSRSLEMPRLTAAILGWQGYWFAYVGEFEKGRRALEEANAIFRGFGDYSRMPLANLAELLFASGDLDGAIATVREGLAVAREYGTGRGIAACNNNLAAYLLAAGRLHDAWVPAREALEYSFRNQRTMCAGVAMQHIAQIAARAGDTETAAHLLGFVDAVYARQRHQREPTERYGHDRILALLRAAYSPSRLAALLAEGAACDETGAVALASTVPLPAQ